MKKIIAMVFTGLISQSVLADQEVVLHTKIQVDEYISSISGPVGCKMPSDTLHLKTGECEVKKETLNTGFKLVKNGDTCYLDTFTVADWKEFKDHELTFNIPQTKNHRKTVDCPAS
jgi:hypothetical protein